MRIGSIVKIRGKLFTIIKIYRLGCTVDVQSLDNPNVCYRVSGLPAKGRK